MAKPVTRVAVLMPCYNPGSDIEDTLKSLKAQNIPFKLFVVDDGSQRKPDFKSLLEGFDHHLIELPQNVGVMLVRNSGLQAILSEDFDYVALIDCGDIAAPDRLRKQKEYLDQNPDIGLVGSWIEMKRGDNPKYVLTFPATHEEAHRLAWFNMPVCHPVLMIRSGVFRKIGLYVDRFDAAEDYEMVRSALDAGFRIANVQDVLFYKIETPQSVSWSRRRGQVLSRLKIQWKHRNLRNADCLKGLLKTLAILAIPDKFTAGLKAAVNRLRTVASA